MRFKFAAILFVIMFGLNSPLFAQSNTNFATIDLPFGISTKIPKGWRILNSDYIQIMQTTVEASLNLSGMRPIEGKSNLIAVNSNPPSTYASIKIDSLTPPSLQISDLKSINSNDLKIIEKIQNDALKKILANQNFILIEFIGCRIDKIDNNITLVTEYRRSGANGNVKVQINQIFREKQELIINLAYRETEAQFWVPILNYIRQSISIK